MMNIRLEAYKIILKVLKKNIFSDKLLKQRKNKSTDPDDNIDLLYMLVKGVIKMKNNLDYYVSAYVDPDKYEKTDLKIKIVLYLAFYQLIYCDQIPTYAAVDESVELAKKTFGEKVGKFVNAVLRNHLRGDQVTYPRDPAANLAVRFSFPVNLVNKWIEQWGEGQTEVLCEFFNRTPLLSVRINMYATNRKKLIDYFKRREIELTPSPATENILTSDSVYEILTDVAFSEGYYSIQDASAALVVELLDPSQHDSVLDLFSAPGGKATYIAELMRNTGEIIAIDKFPNKIKKLKQAIERLKLNNIKAVVADALKYGPIAPAYDKVLLDVPCSGWGVFQKKAELRWQENQDIPKLLRLQEAALKRGSQFVKVNGYLVYSTCTLNPDENEEQIRKFLNKNRNFIIEPAEKYLPGKYLKNNYLLTLPFKHNMDGAFAAKLKRVN